jgi:hypothetical protein
MSITSEIDGYASVAMDVGIAMLGEEPGAGRKLTDVAVLTLIEPIDWVAMAFALVVAKTRIEEQEAMLRAVLDCPQAAPWLARIGHGHTHLFAAIQASVPDHVEG